MPRFFPSLRPNQDLEKLCEKIGEDLHGQMQPYDGSLGITEDVLSAFWTAETAEQGSFFLMLMKQLRVYDADSVAKFRQSLKLLSIFALIGRFPKTLADLPYTDKDLPLSADQLTDHFKNRSFNPYFIEKQVFSYQLYWKRRPTANHTTR